MTATMSAPRMKLNIDLLKSEPAKDAKSMLLTEVLGSTGASKIAERMNKAFP